MKTVTQYVRSWGAMQFAMLVIALFALLGMLPPGMVLFAGVTATYNPTKTTDLTGLWRKVQGPLRVAANFMFSEWDELNEFKNFDVDWSTREITAPFDLNEDVGVASIPEGGYEARPSSPTVVDASFTWILLNKRFTITKTARWIDQKSKGAMIANQLQFQGRKALEAIGRRMAAYFYGVSSGVIAKIGTIDAGATTATQTITLVDAYGIASIDNAAFISSLLRKDEWVAFIRGGALVANAIGKITTYTVGSAQIIVTFNAATTLAAADSLVFANSLENTTIDGTDYGRGLTGFSDGFRTTALQGITHDNWLPARSVADAQRYTNIRFRKAKQAIENKGGGTMNRVRMSQGVENDVFEGLRTGTLRFTDAYGMDLDGSFKAKGVDIKSTRHVPPTHVFQYVAESIQKMVLLPKPGKPSWNDAEKIKDVSGYVFSIDYPCQMVWLNRGNLALEENKTEQ